MNGTRLIQVLLEHTALSNVRAFYRLQAVTLNVSTNILPVGSHSNTPNANEIHKIKRKGGGSEKWAEDGLFYTPLSWVILPWSKREELLFAAEVKSCLPLLYLQLCVNLGVVFATGEKTICNSRRRPFKSLLKLESDLGRPDPPRPLFLLSYEN